MRRPKSPSGSRSASTLRRRVARVAGRIVISAIVASLALASMQLASAHTWYSSVRKACADSPTKMRCYHQLTRRRAGLHALRPRHRLHRAALLKVDRIVACSRPLHTPCGDSFLRPFYQAGYLPARSWVAGENLAWGWHSRWGAFNGLMHSAPHRENILRPSFRDIGIERRSSPWGRFWVIHYGRRW